MALAALFLVFALLLVLGAPVAIALIISTISAALVVGIPPIVVGQQAAADISNVGLLAIPLFDQQVGFAKVKINAPNG